ncbi:MAG TPA: cupredoxin domain-containing protein [Solirubrobacterales bacterium]|nr:cupredoxin domain-containing protein [Solirubrobacterales bacterium]
MNSKTRHGWRLIAVAAVALGLLLVGVHGAGAALGATAGASKVKQVDIAGFAFKPATLTIAKGDSVSFANSSRVSHTATRGGAFDTGVIKPGKSVAVRFRQKGTFRYHCMIHPSMRGKVVVG